MTPTEIDRLAAAAKRLGGTPRELLVAAAASIDAQADPASLLARVRANDGKRATRVEACANLLLVPVASYARDEVVNLLAEIWPRRQEHS
ncbi:MAG: hypothetical protein J0L88_05720 [Xanthomonadales bacterium]|nr:hypothetical protein [Xanthomonadales bacterium]